MCNEKAMQNNNLGKNYTFYTFYSESDRGSFKSSVSVYV